MNLLVEHANVGILPVCHYRVEFAQLVVEAVRDFAPSAIAVELPAPLQQTFIAAVDRLPFLSVVVYRPEHEPVDGRRGYLVVEPADPAVEAARQARDRHIEFHCVDAGVFDYPERYDGLPDPYAVVRIGGRAYYDAAEREVFSRETPDPLDEYREAVMAYRVRELAQANERVLLVCGMAHAERIRRRLAEGRATPFGIEHPADTQQIDHRAVQLFNLHEDSSREVLAEWGYLSAAYERARAPRGDETPTERERISPRIISFASRRRLGERETEPAPLPSPAEPHRELPIDRQVVVYDLLRTAAARYTEDTGDRVGPQQMRVLMKFLRNYALVRGRLQPDIYQIAVGARGAVDDNYAWEVWDLATFYPWQDASGAHPTLRLRIEDLFDASRTIRFHRRLKTRRKRPILAPVRDRKRERRPGEWAEAFDGSAICSYPPEDIAIEGFGGFLKKKAKSVISEELSRTEPFTTSILDGIDVRETIRNWHEGKIYVREHQKVRGDVGSVVVVFDEDRDADRYPWLMTWLGEHEQE
ncbi:MAG TPA: hypothetical protein PLF26_15905, partial [Blastocatellia bacterium]|nr:hypothetical protein [Blastocatellia bacterium]